MYLNTSRRSISFSLPRLVSLFAFPDYIHRAVDRFSCVFVLPCLALPYLTLPYLAHTSYVGWDMTIVPFFFLILEPFSARHAASCSRLSSFFVASLQCDNALWGGGGSSSNYGGCIRRGTGACVTVSRECSLTSPRPAQGQPFTSRHVYLYFHGGCYGM